MVVNFGPRSFRPESFWPIFGLSALIEVICSRTLEKTYMYGAMGVYYHVYHKMVISARSFQPGSFAYFPTVDTPSLTLRYCFAEGHT